MLIHTHVGIVFYWQGLQVESCGQMGYLSNKKESIECGTTIIAL